MVSLGLPETTMAPLELFGVPVAGFVKPDALRVKSLMPTDLAGRRAMLLAPFIGPGQVVTA